MNLTCFKTYDIRGKLGEELNTEVAYRIGRAYASYLNARAAVVGGDARATSVTLKHALISGLRDENCAVFDIGMCGTEEIYHATAYLGVDGGIVVTASHNPINFNGMKLVRQDSRPISGDTGLDIIRKKAEMCDFNAVESTKRAAYKRISTFDAYLSKLISFINVDNLKPLKIVVNAGNGAAGPIIDGLEEFLPFEFIRIHHEPDSTFPNGIPNPLLPKNRGSTEKAVIEHKANLGIAWDGDFDRCFLFDQNGRFIEGYYIVGLLAEAFLRKSGQESNNKIIHDPRLTWNTVDVCQTFSGVAIQSKTGHAFIKERMRQENAIYGGEMSAHHYFRDFAYCDSGMIPWLLVAEIMSLREEPLSELVDQRIKAFPCSGEINLKLENPSTAIATALEEYSAEALNIDRTDGISVDMAQWRFNLRMSNTESVLRLNVESKGDEDLMTSKTKELLHLLKSSG